MKKIQIISILAAILLAPFAVNAGDCYSDPVYDRDWHGKYNVSAYVRDNACSSGTNIIDTVIKGTVVNIIAETDGWYKVKTTSGKIGWTGSALITKTDEALSQAFNTVIKPETQIQASNTKNTSFLNRVHGRLLLQVQNHGEIWYVNPVDNRKYEIKQNLAMNLFRNHALGINNVNIKKIPTVTEKNHSQNITIRNQLSGRILLQVEDSGKTWYVVPGSLNRVQITTGNILEIFRRYSLGISNDDLSKIANGDLNEEAVNINEQFNLKDVGIVPPADWQKFSRDGYSFHYPQNWYSGQKSGQSNWTYLSEEKDYIDNLNTQGYLNVDSYVVTYKLANRVGINEGNSTALKQGGYYLSGYTIKKSEEMKINGSAALREFLYAPKGTVVYGNRATTENETIILYTYRKGVDLYRIQYFNAHWEEDYGLNQFEAIAKSFKIN